MRNGGYDGKVHSRIAKFIAAVLVVASIPLAFIDWQLAGLAIGGLIGWFLTPDIDHQNMTHEEYRALRILKAVGAAWIGFWSLYPLMFKHRSRVSHSLLGTLTRALYLGVPIYFLLNALGCRPTLSPVFLGSILTGWMIQDMAHYKYDGLGWTGWRR